MWTICLLEERWIRCNLTKYCVVVHDASLHDHAELTRDVWDCRDLTNFLHVCLAMLCKGTHFESFSPTTALACIRMKILSWDTNTCHSEIKMEKTDGTVTLQVIIRWRDFEPHPTKWTSWKDCVLSTYPKHTVIKILQRRVSWVIFGSQQYLPQLSRFRLSLLKT